MVPVVFYGEFYAGEEFNEDDMDELVPKSPDPENLPIPWFVERLVGCAYGHVDVASQEGCVVSGVDEYCVAQQLFMYQTEMYRFFIESMHNLWTCEDLWCERYVQEPYARYKHFTRNSFPDVVEAVPVNGHRWIRSASVVSHYLKCSAYSGVLAQWRAEEVPCTMADLQGADRHKIQGVIALLSTIELMEYYKRLLGSVCGQSGSAVRQSYLDAPLSQCFYSFNECDQEVLRWGLDEFAKNWAMCVNWVSLDECIASKRLQYALQAFLNVMLLNIDPQWDGPAVVFFYNILERLLARGRGFALGSFAYKIMKVLFTSDLKGVRSTIREGVVELAKELLEGCDCVTRYYTHIYGTFVAQAGLANPAIRPPMNFIDNVISEWGDILLNTHTKSDPVLCCLLCCCSHDKAKEFLWRYDGSRLNRLLVDNLTCDALDMVYENRDRSSLK